MICLVTGAAGFIASHLCQRLLKEGYSVIGIDSFASFYPKWIKKKNIDPFLKNNKFQFISEDLSVLDLREVMKKANYVFHLAAQPGVRTSWGQNFSIYIKNNIHITQKLLEISKDSSIEKFIYSSSSSVYGLSPKLPLSETSRLIPLSPYGVTKLAAEQLCFLYFKNFGVPIISLRFFTVYGPGQRPDMAFHKFFKALIKNQEISVYGDGKQTRDFTYVDDIVDACVASLKRGKIGETYNIGGGHREKLENIFCLLEEICQKQIKINWIEKQKGDVPHTFADIRKARKGLGYCPKKTLHEGLKEEWHWIQRLYSH